MDIRATEQQLYETVFSTVDSYHASSPGEGLLPLFLDMAKAKTGSNILDAGCGSGKGAAALRGCGFSVWMCDLTDAGLTETTKGLPFRTATLWHPLVPQLGSYQAQIGFDYVYCCDVLEHIPTPFTMLVIARLLEVTRKGLFLSISLRQDVFGAWVGESLHKTVQPFTAWRDQLGELGTVIEARDLLDTGVYLVAPRE